jgi:hypothetical protein
MMPTDSSLNVRPLICNPLLLFVPVKVYPKLDSRVQVSEQCERLLDLLGNTELGSIALWKMEGDTKEEIASKLQCAAPTRREHGPKNSLLAFSLVPVTAMG